MSHLLRTNSDSGQHAYASVPQDMRRASHDCAARYSQGLADQDINSTAAALELTLKTRIARKPPYVELVVEIASSRDSSSFDLFVCPVLNHTGIIVNWNPPN
jgi:hypothetical protein